MRTAGRRVELAVTDTHALVWWAQGRPSRLGRNARKLYEAVGEGRATLFVPTLVLVEIADLAGRGIVRLSDGVADWTRGLLSTGRFFAAELTVDVVLRAEALHAIPERTDRLIAATAAQLGYPLVTRDVRVAQAEVDVIW